MNSSVAPKLEHGKKLTLLLDMEQDPTSALGYAIALCRKWQLELHIIATSDSKKRITNPYYWNFHSVEQYFDNDFSETAAEVTNELEKEILLKKRLAEKELNVLYDTISSSTPTSIDNTMYSMQDDFIYESIGQNTALLVLSAPRQLDDSMRKMESFVDKASNQLHIPVLILNMEEQQLTKHNIKVLLCDNLDKNSESAGQFAESIVEHFPRWTLYHLYVDDGSQISYFATGPYGLSAATESLFFRQQRKKWLIEQLRNRAEHLNFNQDPESRDGCSYVPLIEVGSVPKMIKKTIFSVCPDLVVLGRHMPFYWKDLRFGNMPLHRMFGLGGNICIIP